MSTATRSSAEIVSLFDDYVIPNYRRYPIALTHGQGSYVWDAEGNKYLDLFPGWGCNMLGYCPPTVVEAIREQVGELIHVPNTWYIEKQGEFAEAICTRSFGKVFFCNSGAEAIEGALKLARLATPEGKYKTITFENGFHGRTFGAVTATAQPKYHQGLGPMLPGFQYCRHNDLDAVRELVDEETCAILVEPVQGEGGINIPFEDYLAGLRQICDDNGLMLIFDEVQTCMGRTGTWFGHQQWGVEPDIMTMAKGIASGVACGAIVAQHEVAPSLRPGMHASTFGGNPIAMAAGLATIQTIENENLLDNVAVMSARFKEQLGAVAAELSIIREIRVRGLMIGIDLEIPSTPAVAKAMERGVLINATHDTVVRLLPAINITAEDVDRGVEVIAGVLKEMQSEGPAA